MVVLAFVLAVLAPVIWSLSNVIDKFVVSKKVLDPFAFTVVAGMVNLSIGLVVSVLLDWDILLGGSSKALVFPLICGAIYGVQFYLYYYTMRKEDVSSIIGFTYLYPLVVALLSYFFLGERLGLGGYIGVFLVLAGVISLSVRAKNMRFRVKAILIAVMIFNIALYNFFIKLSTYSMPEINAIALTQVFTGLVICCGIFHRRTRHNLLQELHNWRWSFLNETLTFLGFCATFYSMAALSATIVASISALRPICVLFLEFIFQRTGLFHVRDERITPKLVSLGLIMLGIIFLS